MTIRPGNKYRYYPGVAMEEGRGGPGYINPEDKDMSMRGSLVTVRIRSEYNNNWWDVTVHRDNVHLEMSMLICTECLLPVSNNNYIATQPKNSP